MPMLWCTDFDVGSRLRKGCDVGRVVHFEIHADDPEQAARFYRELFGWRIEKWDGPMEYWMVFTGPDGTPGINGGLMRRQQPLSGNDGVIAYVCTVNVDDLDRSMAHGAELGAAVAMPRFPVTGVGWMAYLKDPAGNVFGLMQMDKAVSGPAKG
jgi:predicted enzyme related to lactoylglutathione lyase